MLFQNKLLRELWLRGDGDQKGEDVPERVSGDGLEVTQHDSHHVHLHQCGYTRGDRWQGQGRARAGQG